MDYGASFSSALSFILGIGSIVVGGPLVAWTIGALEEAVIIGGLSAIGATLYGIGIPKDNILNADIPCGIRRIEL